MKSNIYNIYYKLGINKTAIIFLVAGIIIIISAKLYAKRHFMTLAEKDLITIKTASHGLARYSAKGLLTYDELITRARNYDEYYINEAREIANNISFPAGENKFIIPSDERFPHIKFRQIIDRFRDTISEKLPGVNVYGKFFEIESLHTSLEGLNESLKSAWLLKTFVDRMLENGFSNDHLASISIGDPGSHIALNDLNVFESVNIAMIEAQFRLNMDELLKVFEVLRSKQGYFMVEDVHIQPSDRPQISQENRVGAKFRILVLNLIVKDSVTYSPVTPQWKLDAAEE